MKSDFNIKKISTDLVWYLLGAIIPGILGLIKNPVFTNYFTKEEYGLFNIAFISNKYLSVILYSWIVSSVWRYYLNYKKKNKLFNFFSTSVFFYVSASLLLLLLNLVIILLYGSSALKYLFILAAIQMITGGFLNLIFVIYRIQTKSKRYNLLNSLRAILNFTFLFLLTYKFQLRTEAFFYSIILVDAGFILFVSLSHSKIIKQICFSSIDKFTFLRFLKYGSVGVLLNFFLLLLESSDRYMIVYFLDFEAVGVYSINYNLSLISVNMLIAVFLNTVRPDLLNCLENNRKLYAERAGLYMSVFIALFFPLVSILSIHSNEIALLLFAEEFRTAYELLPYVFFSAFLYGLSHYVEIKLKFENKLKNLILIFFFVLVVNLISNYIFLPVYGISAAAITTLAAYFLLLVLLFIQVPQLISNLNFKLIFPFVFLVLLYFVVFLFVYENYFYQASNFIVFLILFFFLAGRVYSRFLK